MKAHRIGIAVLLFVASRGITLAACGTSAPDDPLTVSKAWWSAFATGDSAYVAARTADHASFTINNGRTLDREQIVAETAKHAKAAVSVVWADESMRFVAPPVAVVTARATETVGERTARYRYLAVVQCAEGEWRLAAAQSTRELTETPRVPAATAGSLQDFSGRYRTPANRTLEIVAADTSLVLIDPTGARAPLEPIGPALFEVRGVSVQGLIRFSFVRDATGAVVAINRITTEITTYPRLPATKE